MPLPASCWDCTLALNSFQLGGTTRNDSTAASAYPAIQPERRPNVIVVDAPARQSGRSVNHAITAASAARPSTMGGIGYDSRMFPMTSRV